VTAVTRSSGGEHRLPGVASVYGAFGAPADGADEHALGGARRARDAPKVVVDQAFVLGPLVALAGDDQDPVVEGRVDSGHVLAYVVRR